MPSVWVTLAISLVALGDVAIVALAVVAKRQLAREKQNVLDVITDYMSGDADHPSKFIQQVDVIGTIIGNRVAQSAMAALRGSLGGANKAGNAEQLAMMEAEDPVMGLAGALGGKTLSRKLGKNPVLLMAAQAAMSKLLPGFGSKASSGTHTSNGSQSDRMGV